MTVSLAGQLLVASPVLEDPNFARSVVLLLEHTEEGALGLALNRPSANPVADALPKWAGLAAVPAKVFLGGPVEPQAAICLGTLASGTTPAGLASGTTPAGWRRLTGAADALGVFDLTADPARYRGARVRVFAGYAGWSADQLESEISIGGWYAVDSRPSDVLTEEPESLWREVLRRQGGSLAMVATFPPDPRLN